MKKRIEHDSIGAMDILLEFETHVNGKPQYLAFAQSFYRLNELGFGTWQRYSNSNRLKPIHYLLWSNTSDFHLAGATELLTKYGRPMTYRSALKEFHKAVKNLEHITFKKCA